MTAHQAPYREPAFICTYGPSGIGKTVDALYSFPHGLFLAAPGALKPAEWIGMIPGQLYEKDGKPHEVRSVMEATALLKTRGDALRKKFNAVIIDDFSLLVERTLQLLELKFKNFDLWRELRDVILDFRDTARRSELHVLVNAHDAPAATKANGQWIRGGPRLPGQMQADFPPATDLCLRACVVSDNRLGWRGAYRCTPIDTDWATKDRHRRTPDFSPMNVGEILRLAGYQIRRHDEMPWQEQVVTAISDMLVQVPCVDNVMDAAQAKPVLQAAVDRLRAKYTQDQRQIDWTLRDAIDRTHLRHASASRLGMYGVT